MKRTIYMIIAAAAVLLSFDSCSLYRHYERPDMFWVDSLYRRIPASADTVSSASVSWDTFFTDSLLRSWIELGLKHNTDINVARFKVQEAEAALQAARWALLPGASFSLKGGLPGTFSTSVNASWETDIFGSLRNASRKAEAAVKQSEAYKQAVQTQMVAAIANSYYTLLMLDEQLAISKRTLGTWDENIRTLEALKRAGQTNEAAVMQAKANKFNVEANILTLEKEIMAVENSFCALLGTVPMHIERGRLIDQKMPESL